MSSNSLYSPLSSDEDCDNAGQDVESGRHLDHGSSVVKRKHSSKHHRRKHPKKKLKDRRHKSKRDGDASSSSKKHKRHRKDRPDLRRNEAEDDLEEPDNDDQYDPKPRILSSKPLVPEYDDISDTDDIQSQSFDDQRNVYHLDFIFFRSPFSNYFFFILG